MRKIVAPFLGTLFLVTACGGGNGSALVATPLPPPTPPAQTQAQAQALACVDLTAVTSDSVTVTSATSVTTPLSVSSAGGAATVTVPFCRVQGVAKPSAESEIRFEVWLPPTASGWNGRMKVEATGGFLGGIPYTRMGQMIEQGWVEAGSNLGHEGGESASWALNPEKVKDYGYRANFYVATAAKALANAFYAQPVKYSYFEGCSGGGRQAQMMAQRYPDLFDGILVGAPSMFYSDGVLNLYSQSRLQFPTASRYPNDPVVPATKLAMVNAAAVAACDSTDGLVDGQITKPQTCKFDPTPLLCSGADSANCLTTQQLDVVRGFYRGARRADGTPIYSGTMPGSEKNWRGLGDIADNGYGPFTGHVVYGVDGFDWRSIDFDLDYNFIKSAIDPLMSSSSPDLSKFKARKGKIIQYHGWGDPVVTPAPSPSYFSALALMEKYKGSDIDALISNLAPKQVAAITLNDTAVKDYFRLFMVPGMSHCVGGDGPNSFNQSATAPASSQDAEHNILAALTRWVENGPAPESVIATKFAGNVATNPIERQRPLCLYPKVAKYKGTGDINQASNFTCESQTFEELTPTETDMVQIRNSLRLRGLLSPTK